MSSQQEPTAVAVARAHIEAWGGHDYDSGAGEPWRRTCTWS